jgi:hypothetical protein
MKYLRSARLYLSHDDNLENVGDWDSLLLPLSPTRHRQLLIPPPDSSLIMARRSSPAQKRQQSRMKAAARKCKGKGGREFRACMKRELKK